MKKKYTNIFGKISLLLTILCSIMMLVSLLGEQKIQQEGGSNIAFILDVSHSMNVTDMDSYSRLSHGKEKIIEIIEQYPEYNFALSIFAGESIRILPLMRDRELFGTFLQELDSRNITLQGTNIAGALDDALQNFMNQEGGNIIIITDGDEQEIIISPETLSRIILQNIQVHVIGVGSAEGGYIPSGDILAPHKMYQGKEIIVRLDSKSLRKFSKNVGGEYYDIDAPLNVSAAGGILKYSRFTMFLLLSLMFWFFYIGSIGIKLYHAKK